MKLKLLFCLVIPSLVWGRIEDGCGAPVPALLELLEMYELAHEGTWESIVERTQKAWLLQKGSTLWEMPEKEDGKGKRAYHFFTQLGLTGEKRAEGKQYRYGVVLGSSTEMMRRCFVFLKEERERGVCIDNIVVLVSERVLDERIDDVSLGKTEADAAKALMKEMDFPEKVKIVVAKGIFPNLSFGLSSLDRDASKVPEDEGAVNTGDTIWEWLKQHPEPGPTLFVSSQPFVGRQGCVARNILPASFCVEAVGPEISLGEYLGDRRGPGVFLDALSRWIYEAHGTAAGEAKQAEAVCNSEGKKHVVDRSPESLHIDKSTQKKEEGESQKVVSLSVSFCEIGKTMTSVVAVA